MRETLSFWVSSRNFEFLFSGILRDFWRISRNLNYALGRRKLKGMELMESSLHCKVHLFQKFRNLRSCKWTLSTCTSYLSEVCSAQLQVKQFSIFHNSIKFLILSVLGEKAQKAIRTGFMTEFCPVKDYLFVKSMLFNSF